MLAATAETAKPNTQNPQVKIALVTRNTTASVDAFFRLVGEEWRSAFDAIRTREFRYVKPDKRLLLSLAEVRRVDSLLPAGTAVAAASLSAAALECPLMLVSPVSLRHCTQAPNHSPLPSRLRARGGRPEQH